MDRGAWWATVHGVTKSWTLKRCSTSFIERIWDINPWFCWNLRVSSPRPIFVAIDFRSVFKFLCQILSIQLPPPIWMSYAVSHWKTKNKKKTELKIETEAEWYLTSQKQMAQSFSTKIYDFLIVSQGRSNC